ncbi:MAG: response regulator, partial [Bacteroidota bacterium]
HGFGLLQQVKSSGYFADIPVIILSGYERPLVKQRCLDAGADDYQLKPFNPETILTSIRQTLPNSVAVAS